jgi:hypothetical protein
VSRELAFAHDEGVYAETLCDSLDDKDMSTCDKMRKRAYASVGHVERLRVLTLYLEGGRGRCREGVGRGLHLMGHMLGGRGGEAGMHVGGVGAGRGGEGHVGGIRAIYWDTGVAGRNEGGVIGRAGRGGIGVLGELGAGKVGGRGERGAVEVDALANTKVVEVGEAEARETTLEEGVTEGDLALDVLCVAAESEGLSVSVLLLAGDTRGRTGGALWMLRVALNESETGERRFAVGDYRRDLP